MLLAELLEGVRVTKLLALHYGSMAQTQDIAIRSVQYDSRRVGAGDLFVAIRGEAVDGHAYIVQAMERGAAAVVLEDDGAVPDMLVTHLGVVKMVVPDSRAALARISSNLYGHPSRALSLVGVTGTNGKTTTTHLITSILEADGKRTGMIGTIQYRIGSEVREATHTTPESLELNALLRGMLDAGCAAAVMEVSSHALAMHRVDGLAFRAGVFTNLTQDHLDYHGSMEEYFRAKRRLFEMLGPGTTAVTNVDDPRGKAIVEGIAAPVLTFGLSPDADVTAEDIKLDVSGVRCTVRHGGDRHPLRSSLTGRFNVSNILAACATGIVLKIPWEAILAGVASLGSVRGRFEQIVSPAGWTAVIDYAHTPDALENCLHTIRDVMTTGGRVITVFGCGGNRDAAKRPVMGRIASTLSDVSVVTSDNPRREDPGEIIAQILAGVRKGREVHVEPDRRLAIRQALAMAGPHDVVLIAGKGHETYQVIGDRKTHFDDREEVESFLAEDR